MLESLLARPDAAVFLGASLVLAIAPGPGVAYLVTRTLSRGRAAGLASVIGVALGNLGNAAAAALGLAALVAGSSLAFTVIKLAGAGYLIFLGIRSLSRGDAAATAAPAPRASRDVRDGFWVALLNPKTALFFAAFLPQFVDPAGPVLIETLLLGGVFVLIAIATDSAYVLAAATLGPRLTRRIAAARVGRYASAATFIGLGIYVAIANRPALR